MNKIVFIDNYDSFTYNLVELLRLQNLEVIIFRNSVALEIIEKSLQSNILAIVFSPGPSHPLQSGVCLDLMKKYIGKIPMLGICLGHQAMTVAFGGHVEKAKQLVHGQATVLDFIEHPLFHHIHIGTKVARYHSLVATKNAANFKTIATSQGEVMAIADDENCLYGMQFHPESILTIEGSTMVKNFIELAKTFLMKE